MNLKKKQKEEMLQKEKLNQIIIKNKEKKLLKLLLQHLHLVLQQEPDHKLHHLLQEQDQK